METVLFSLLRVSKIEVVNGDHKTHLELVFTIKFQVLLPLPPSSASLITLLSFFISLFLLFSVLLCFNCLLLDFTN